MQNLSYSRGSSAPLLELTLAEALSRTALKFPDRDAVISLHQNLRYTWREFDHEVTRVARGLAGLGLEPQDRVGIWATNCVEWIFLQYACARAGYVLVNVNPAYKSTELQFVLGRSKMRAIFMHDHDSRSNYQQTLSDARLPEHPLEHIIHLGTSEWDRMLLHGTDLPSEPVLPNHPTNIQYTSGTTGSPKGATLTHINLVNNGFVLGEQIGMTEHDRFCVPFPLYHCAGCVCAVLNSVVHGSAIILPSAFFDPAKTLEAVQAEKATVIGGVPTMFVAELNHPDLKNYDITSLRAAVIGGAPCPVDLLKALNSDLHCDEVAVIYGQTEASPVITMHGPGDTFEQRTTTVGRAMPNVEVKIVDAENRIAPLGEIGEICARGYLVMIGYDQEPAATARAIDSEGWLHTGDLGRMRDDGHVNVSGRLKDMIIRGGENVYPAEIESFLFSHPKVSDVHVIGLPDIQYGEVVAAWIRVKQGETLTPDEIREHCEGKIAHFKIPKHIRIVESFPTTITGKVQKYRIREIEIEALGLASQMKQTA